MLEVSEVSRSFEDRAVLTDVSLQLGEGEIIAIVGPSGCGKSTLLRIIAGLESPDAGRIHLDGDDITERPPQTRGIGMVFQSLALFPHLDVAGNIAFGIPSDLGREATTARIEEMLDLVGLSGFSDRSIEKLSGGEAQRVALARSLAMTPRLLLLDEPLSSLDADLKASLAAEVRALLKATGTPAIHVTHDRGIAELLADRVIDLGEREAS